MKHTSALKNVKNHYARIEKNERSLKNGYVENWKKDPRKSGKKSTYFGVLSYYGLSWFGKGIAFYREQKGLVR